jgi:hypothetical protein
MRQAHIHREPAVEPGNAWCTPSECSLWPQTVARPHADIDTEAVQRPACCIRLFFITVGGRLVVAALGLTVRCRRAFFNLGTSTAEPTAKQHDARARGDGGLLLRPTTRSSRHL